MCVFLKMMSLRFFEVLVNVYQATKRNLGKEFMFCSGNRKSRTELAYKLLWTDGLSMKLFVKR